MSMHRSQVGQQIFEALQEHALWRVRIKEAIRDGVIDADTSCPLGHWLERDADAQLRETHERFHVMLAQIVESIQRGDCAGAAAQVGPDGMFAALCSTLSRELMQRLARVEVTAKHGASACP
jgi:hypothetical protein